MERSKWWARTGAAVRQAMEWGALVPLEPAREECTAAFLLCAIASGLLQPWSDAFPAPRRAPARGLEGIVPAQIAGRLAGRYALRQTGAVRRSARVVGAVGTSVDGVEPAQGVS